MPTPTEQLSMQINLPATRLDLYSNGQFQKSYSVAIGMPKYPTPIRDYNISYIIWNPWWLPPDSEWAQNAEKTPPGPGNPLGPVKMLMEDGIRIHGTNAPRSVGHAASHACLRMKPDDVRELAWRVQQAYSDKRDPDLFEKYKKNSRSTFWVELFQQVPVKVEYLQVEARPDKVLIHPDRYNRGGFQEELETALVSHPEISVNKELVTKLKKLRSKESVEVSYPELSEWARGTAPSATDGEAGKKSAGAL
ncbi:MAG: L,D-transpeptidase [Deltaproteobacteria bacterium]|nr:L,D-transpeptidase [Deltaproteobacteria bacterium]